MQLNSVNNTNFGMAKIKGGFHKIAVDALLEAHSNPRLLSAVKGDLFTIGQSLRGEVRVQDFGDAISIIYRSNPSLLDRLRGAKTYDHMLHPVHSGESPVSIVAHTAESLQRYANLFNKKYSIPPCDLKKSYAEYIHGINKIFKK